MNGVTLQQDVDVDGRVGRETSMEVECGGWYG